MENTKENIEANLIKEYLNGNENALKSLISRHVKLVYNFTYRISGNKEEAHDLTQETFIKVWKNIKKYDADKKFTTWLLTIARNTTFDWLKKKQPKNFSSFVLGDDDAPFEENIEDTALLADEIFEKNEDEKRIEKSLSLLSLSERDVIVLHVYQELSFQEISEILGRPLNTVKSLYRRGLISLRKELGQSPLHQKDEDRRIS